MKHTGLSTQKNHMMCCCCCQAVCMSTVYFSYALCTKLSQLENDTKFQTEEHAIFILEDKSSSH